MYFQKSKQKQNISAISFNEKKKVENLYHVEIVSSLQVREAEYKDLLTPHPPIQPYILEEDEDDACLHLHLPPPKQTPIPPQLNPP